MPHYYNAEGVLTDRDGDCPDCSPSSTSSTVTDKKKFLIVNDADPNDQFQVIAADENEAAFKALERLGWFVSGGDELDNQDEILEEN